MLALLMGTWTTPGLAKDPDSIDLNAYQWKNRLLLLFAPSEKDPSYLSIIREIERQTRELLDRDLLIVHVLEKGESRLGKEPLNPGQVLFLKRHFSIPQGQFVIILVGKDGGEKLRQDRPVELKEVFRIIDAMPMRRQEMEKK